MEESIADVVHFLVGVSISTSNLFFYCFYGKLATDCYIQFPQYLFESNWWKFKVKQQKMISTMICNAQQPLYYHGSGIVNLNLETFQKVNNSIFLACRIFIVDNHVFFFISDVENSFQLLHDIQGRFKEIICFSKV